MGFIALSMSVGQARSSRPSRPSRGLGHSQVSARSPTTTRVHKALPYICAFIYNLSTIEIKESRSIMKQR